MFNSAPRVAHVCLRCQRNLACRALRYLDRSSRPFLDGGSVRHQGAAAARPLDEFDDHDEEIKSASIPHDAHDEGDAPAANERPLFRGFRKLRRAPTTGLGVESLGKPSEIILLPSHDRVLPESVEYEEGPKQNLSDAIESEKKPLAWEQVKEYIEKTHAGLETQQGPLSVEEWAALKIALKRGFNRAQLLKFLQEESPETVLPDDAGRLALAALIATEIWGYQLPQVTDQSSSIAEQSRSIEQEELVSKEFKFTNENDVLVFQRDPAYGLQALSRLHNVSVSVRGGTVTVRGAKEAAVQARKWLSLRRPRVKPIALDGFGDIFRSKNKRDMAELDTRIGTARGVTLVPHAKQDGMTVRFMQANKSAVIDVRRDLRLLVENKTMPSSIAAARPERVRFAPYFARTPVAWTTDAMHWGRAFDTVAAGSTGMTRRAETSSWVDDHWQSNKKLLDHPLHQRALESPNATRCEFSARLGLNLYQLEDMNKVTGLSCPKKQTWFLDEVPLMAQLLASKDFRQRPPTTETDVPVESPFLTRLLLKPVNLRSLAPSIEIYLYGKDKSAGLCQTLNVARITAIFTESRTRNLSLPSHPVDVSFDRQIKQDLFVHRSPSTSQHATLLQSIGVYLANARKVQTDTPKFWSFASLQIPTDLVDMSESSEAKFGQKVEYVLANAEAVQTNARLLPSSLGFDDNNRRMVLEQRLFSGGKWGPDRQEVHLIQQPLLAAPVSKGIGLDDLRRVSMDMVERFGDLGRQLRHRMQAVR